MSIGWRSSLPEVGREGSEMVAIFREGMSVFRSGSKRNR
jgi:hypothetical protein